MKVPGNVDAAGQLEIGIVRLLKQQGANIYFWIIIFFCVRLLGIQNPPLEISHNWRQTTVAMVARNFAKPDASIFYPQIDIAGHRSGITGMEFPVFNYMIYLVSEVFGYDHWYGRLINLIVSSIGLVFFYKLVRRLFDQKTAFYASWILLFSIWFSFSRKIMPDTFAMSLMIIGLYATSRFLLANRFQLSTLLLSFFFVALATLSKIPSAYILILLVPVLANKNIHLDRKIGLLASAMSTLVLALSWYYYWVPNLNLRFGFDHFFMGKDFNVGAVEIFNQLGSVFRIFYEKAIKFFGFALFLIGVYNTVKKKQHRLLITLGFAIAGFWIFMFAAGESFVRHDYYVVPFVPIMALLAGYGLTSISSNRLTMILVIAIGLEGILNQYHDIKIGEDYRPILELESDLNTFSNGNDRILINCGEYPTPMYFANRKGWILSNDEITQTGTIKDLQNLGLKYIVILKNVFGSDLDLDYPVFIDKEAYTIYVVM